MRRDGNVHQYLAVTIDGIDYLLVGQFAAALCRYLDRGVVGCIPHRVQLSVVLQSVGRVAEAVVLYPAVVIEEEALTFGQHLAVA